MAGLCTSACTTDADCSSLYSCQVGACHTKCDPGTVLLDTQQCVYGHVDKKCFVSYIQRSR